MFKTNTYHQDTDNKTSPTQSEIDLLVNLASSRTPLELFEEDKNHLIQKHATDATSLDLDLLKIAFLRYAQFMMDETKEQEDEFTPLTQLPDAEYETQYLRDEVWFHKRRIIALAYPEKATPEDLLIIRDRRPASPLFDYYHILLLWRAQRYDAIETLCLKLTSHIDQIRALKQKQCALIPYYYQHSDKEVEKLLHPLMTVFSLSEVYYYLAKAKQALDKPFSKYLAGCYYMRSRHCLANDLVEAAKIYIDRAITIENHQPFHHLKDFITLLKEDEKQTANANNPPPSCSFVERNLRFCIKYSELLSKKANMRPTFLAVLANAKKEFGKK